MPDAESRRSNWLKLKFCLPPWQSDAENVPDAEIRRSNSLKLKFGLPPALNVPDTEIRRSSSLNKFKFGRPGARSLLSFFLGSLVSFFWGSLLSFFLVWLLSFFLVRKQPSRTRGALVGLHPAPRPASSVALKCT